MFPFWFGEFRFCDAVCCNPILENGWFCPLLASWILFVLNRVCKRGFLIKVGEDWTAWLGEMFGRAVVTIDDDRMLNCLANEEKEFLKVHCVKQYNVIYSKVYYWILSLKFLRSSSLDVTDFSPEWTLLFRINFSDSLFLLNWVGKIGCWRKESLLFWTEGDGNRIGGLMLSTFCFWPNPNWISKEGSCCERNGEGGRGPKGDPENKWFYRVIIYEEGP